MKRKARSAIATGIMIASGLLALTGGPLVSEAGAVPPPAVVENQTYGASYGEWGARWWQWVLSIPAAVNPVLDQSGANCARGQYDTVWFLAGSFGGSVTRVCTVPAGKPLFFPLLNGGAFKPKGFESLLDLRNLAGASLNTAAALVCKVDGADCAADLFKFRASTPSFTVIAPAKGLIPPGQLTVPGNTDSMVADGYWMLLQPLPPGQHTVKLGGTMADGFTVDVTYLLTVQ
jgi:hypothetical protein